jgi:hypothetical protein
MTTSSGPGTNTSMPPPYKRSMKNLLIDPRFQLKYTGIIVGVALVISLFLGAFLWKTSRDVVAESQRVVEQSERVAEESKKVSDVVRMSIKDDPVYGQNPELAAAYNSAASDADKQILAQQESLVHQQRAMIDSQRTTLFVLVGALLLLVVLIGLLGIYITHKVAGPIFKMKMLLRQVGDGKLVFQGRLRKGDELQEFFETFTRMVDKLRERQQSQVELLSNAIEMAKANGRSDDSIGRIMTVRDRLKSQLGD